MIPQWSSVRYDQAVAEVAGHNRAKSNRKNCYRWWLVTARCFGKHSFAMCNAIAEGMDRTNSLLKNDRMRSWRRHRSDRRGRSAMRGEREQ